MLPLRNGEELDGEATGTDPGPTVQGDLEGVGRGP